MHPLATLKSDTKIGEILPSLYSAQSTLEFLLEKSVVPLRTCRRKGYDVLDAIREVLSVENKNEVLDFMQAYQISNGVTEFETVFAAELQLLDTYLVSQKALYSTPDLIENAEIIFPEKIRQGVPTETIQEIRQAGRSLAFELPTAAGFHVLRATEAVIRQYYTTVVGTLPKVKARNWGTYIKFLKQKEANTKILSALEQMKDMHRNPIMHPEDTLTMEDAITLFGIAQGVIVSIVVDIERRLLEKESAIEQAPALPAAAAGIS